MNVYINKVVENGVPKKVTSYYNSYRVKNGGIYNTNANYSAKKLDTEIIGSDIKRFVPSTRNQGIQQAHILQLDVNHLSVSWLAFEKDD